MATENKTFETQVSVVDFLNNLPDEQKKLDSFQLVELMSDWSKPAFSLYVYSPTDESEPLLDELGKYKISKACIYVKKLSDISIPTLKKMCESTIAYLNEHHECACREK